MGQIKNIKLHIVTDIKLNAWTLTLPPVIDATSCKRHPIPQANMNGHSDTEEGMVNGDAKDALSSVLGTPKPMSALPRIPKKKNLMMTKTTRCPTETAKIRLTRK